MNDAAPPYFLCSARLGFRVWRAEDLDLARCLWGDREGMALAGGPLGEEAVRERLAREMATQRAHGLQYWPVFLRDGGVFVGCCGVRPYQTAERVHELGFRFMRDQWGRGLATEAARAAIAYAFEALGAAALFAGHHPENAPSRRVLAKLGFRYTHDEFYAPTGLMHPSYRLTCAEWAAAAASASVNVRS